MSSQERIDIRGRDPRPDPPPARPAGPAPGAERLPRPPGGRRPGLAVLAVLLIVLGAAVAGLLAMRLDDRVPVLVARQPIGPGEQIVAGDLAVARIASDGIAVIPAGQAAQVIGKYANTRIEAGRLIDAGMLATSGLLVNDNVAVGVALQPGRMPASGLQSGDIVQVIRSVDGVGKVIAGRATVSSVQAPHSNSFGSTSGDTVVVTVIVSERTAAPVAAASAANQASVVLIQRGATLGSG